MGNWRRFLEDSNGNGSWDLDQTRTDNKSNEIIDISQAGPAWVTPVYSRSGNMITLPHPFNSALSLTATYDPWNRLVAISADSSGTFARYEYDAAKRRHIKRSYSEAVLLATSHMYYTVPAIWQIIEERLNSSSVPSEQNVWSVRKTDRLVIRDDSPDDEGGLTRRVYAIQDELCSVVTAMNEAGSVLERYSYDPYGQTRFFSDSFIPRSDSDISWSYQYAGYKVDSESSLLYARNRFLHSSIGNWLQRDPIRERPFDCYRYADLRPTVRRDAFGLIAGEPVSSSVQFGTGCLVGLGIETLTSGLKDLVTFSGGHFSQSELIRRRFCGSLAACVGGGLTGLFVEAGPLAACAGLIVKEALENECNAIIIVIGEVWCGASLSGALQTVWDEMKCDLLASLISAIVGCLGGFWTDEIEELATELLTLFIFGEVTDIWVDNLCHWSLTAQ